MQWKNGHADPMEMSYLLGIAGGCLAAVLILVCLCIYAIRTRKCCFKGKFLICLLLLFQADSHIFFVCFKTPLANTKFSHWISLSIYRLVLRCLMNKVILKNMSKPISYIEFFYREKAPGFAWAK